MRWWCGGFTHGLRASRVLPMRVTILVFLVVLATGLSACGQRVYPKTPADRVHDSTAF